MDILQTAIERWGFPAVIVIWLMRDVMREMRAQRAQITKLVVVNAVILKTLDVPEAAEMATKLLEEQSDDKGKDK